LRAQEVARLDATTASPEAFWSEVDGQKVALVSNVFFASDGAAREQWTSAFIERCVALTVTAQEREASTGVVEVGEVLLGEFLELCYDSSHAYSVFLLDEDLLSGASSGGESPADGVAPPELGDLAAAVAVLPPRLWPDGDLFALFPRAVRPKAPCLVMGGAGARSTLHADPMSWTGWNYCLEGSKLWTFFPPDDDDRADKVRGSCA